MAYEKIKERLDALIEVDRETYGALEDLKIMMQSINLKIKELYKLMQADNDQI